MTRCNWCGLISDDDAVCSWCKKPFAGSASPLVERGRRLGRRFNSNIAAAALCLAIVLLVIFFRALPPRPASATPTTVGKTDTGIPRSGRFSSVGIPLSSQLQAPISVAPDQASTPAADGANPNAIGDTTLEEANSNSDVPLVVAPSEVGSVRLVGASLATQQDDNGREIAGGSVTIANDGPYPITNFRLSLYVNDEEHALSAFEGSIDNPVPLMTRTIPPGGQIQIPVMTRAYDADNSYELLSISIRATVDGPPGTVTDTYDVP